MLRDVETDIEAVRELVRQGKSLTDIAASNKYYRLLIRKYGIEESVGSVSIVGKILIEASTPAKYAFDQVIPNMYAFIFRDTTKFPTPQEKWDIITYLEKLRKNTNSLPLERVNPQMLVSTQGNENEKQFAKTAFAVKFHGIYYLLNGKFENKSYIVDKKNWPKIRVYDLDNSDIGQQIITSVNNTIR